MNIRRLVTNIGSILTSEALNRAVTFVIYLLVARHLDDTIFGRLSLALTLLYITQVLASFGLNTYISREASKDRESIGRYFVHGILVALVASGLAYLGLVTFTVAVGYASETRAAILLLGVGAAPFAVAAVCHGIFQALERMYLIPLLNVPANLLKLGVALVLLQRGVGLEGVILAMVGAQLLAGAGVFLTALRIVSLQHSSLEIRAHHLKGLVRGASAFVGIDVVIALWTGLPLMLLSLFAAEADVGHFSAAYQLIVPVSLLMNATMVAALPLMSRTLNEGAQQLRAITKSVLTLILILALPAAVGLFIVAEDALRLIYGEGFEAASVVLTIVSPLVVFQALAAGLGNALFAGMRERVTLRIVSVNCVTALVLGLILIPRFGSTGAAVVSLSVGILNLIQHLMPVNRLLGRTLALVAGAGWRPLIASAAMATVLVVLHIHQVLLALPTGAAVYISALVLIFLLSGGRPSVLRAAFTGTDTRP